MIVFLNKKKADRKHGNHPVLSEVSDGGEQDHRLQKIFFFSIQKWNAVIDRFRENNSSVYLNCLSGVSGLFVF